MKSPPSKEEVRAARVFEHYAKRAVMRYWSEVGSEDDGLSDAERIEAAVHEAVERAFCVGILLTVLDPEGARYVVRALADGPLSTQYRDFLESVAQSFAAAIVDGELPEGWTPPAERMN